LDITLDDSMFVPEDVLVRELDEESVLLRLVGQLCANGWAEVVKEQREPPTQSFSEEHSMIRRVAAIIGMLGGAVIAMTAPISVAIAQTVQIPIFEYDPTFPRPLPENWAIGAIGGLAVDRQDHLYVVQRPGTLRGNERFTGSGDTPPKADCCIPAPPVLGFDQAGTLIHSWGGPGAGYDWPQTEHGVFVDQKDTVWLAGSGENDAQLLKFENFDARRFQRFLDKGLGTPKAGTIPPSIVIR
jgi:hypothetical protein